MRKKRNKNNSTFSTEGYIKKYFGNDISRILTPTNRNLQNCKIPYVHHFEAEEILKDCTIRDPLKDKSLVFTGLTGSGKTSILRHTFGLEINSNQPQFTGTSIIIPVDFNRSQRSAQIAILSSLRVAVEKICAECGISYPDTSNLDFYDYIREKRPDLLNLDPNYGATTSSAERMAAFLNEMPTAYASCQLQYAMDHISCRMQLIILVVDNIEAFISTNTKDSKSRYLAPVIEALKLADCIEQRGLTTAWSFNMVIACRHHIWRIMRGENADDSPETTLLQSYVTTETPYDLANPIKVNDIIQERENVLSTKARDKEKWNTAVDVVNTVLEIMENNIGNFVLQLHLKDIRKSMAKMQEIILHKGLQKIPDEQIDDGAFQIRSIEQFDLTRVNIVKIIGLGNRKYYSDSNSIIPNLLCNEQRPGMELYLLLTLKYFLENCGYSEPAWDNPVSISDFYDVMKSTFEYQDRTIQKRFGRSVHFLIQHRLLLRSADQPQDEAPGLSLADVKKVEHVYVSGASIVLWDELGKSSALFQLFLDDIWLDEESEYFGDDGNDIEHCIKYVQQLYSQEKKIFNTAANISVLARNLYLNCFGTSSICRQLLSGLIASLDTIVKSNDFRSKNRINMAKETLRQAKALFRQVKDWEDKRKSQ